MSITIKIIQASNGYVLEIKREINHLDLLQDFIASAQEKLLGGNMELPELPAGIIPSNSKIEQEEERLIFSTLPEVFNCIEKTLNA